MHCICAGLRNHVEDAAAGAAELHAKISGLYGNLLDGVRNVDDLGRTAKSDVIVLGSIEEVVVSPNSLTVDGKLSSFAFPLPKPATRRLDHAGQGTGQGDGIQADQRQIAGFPR